MAGNTFQKRYIDINIQLLNAKKNNDHSAIKRLEREIDSLTRDIETETARLNQRNRNQQEITPRELAKWIKEKRRRK